MFTLTCSINKLVPVFWFCNFIHVLFTDYVVARIDDLVNWGRRVSVT
jgi:hypothetical protein